MPLQSGNSESLHPLAEIHRILYYLALHRDLIEDLGAVGPLTDLLSSTDVHCQTCAAGALFNVVGAKLEDSEEIQSFKSALSDAIVLGMVRSCLDEV